jgi:hypothetical protein
MNAGVKLATTRMWTQSANSLPLLPFALFFFQAIALYRSCTATDQREKMDRSNDPWAKTSRLEIYRKTNHGNKVNFCFPFSKSNGSILCEIKLLGQ